MGSGVGGNISNICWEGPSALLSALLFKKYFIVYAITFVRISSPFPPSTQPLPVPQAIPTPFVVHVPGLYICYLSNPLTFLQPVPTCPLPSYSCLFHVSVPLIVFCSLIYFVH